MATVLPAMASSPPDAPGDKYVHTQRQPRGQRPYKGDEYKVVLPCGHPLAERERIDIHELDGLPFLLLEHGGKTEVTELLEKSGVHPKIRFTTWEDYAIMAMAERGLGVGILPELILQRIPYRIEIRPLAQPYYRQIGLAMNLYTDTFNGYYPVVIGSNATTENWSVILWESVIRLTRNTSSEQTVQNNAAYCPLYHCPSAMGDFFYRSYGMNDKFSHTRQNRVRNPSRKLLIADAGLGSEGGTFRIYGYTWNKFSGENVALRHQPGPAANILYADGHTGADRRRELMEGYGWEALEHNELYSPTY